MKMVELLLQWWLWLREGDDGGSSVKIWCVTDAVWLLAWKRKASLVQVGC